MEKETKPGWQGKRFGITLRLAKKEDLGTTEVFSHEQWEALRKLRPAMGGSTLLQHALLHYARILPDLLIEEQEKELERLRQLKINLSSME